MRRAFRFIALAVVAAACSDSPGPMGPDDAFAPAFNGSAASGSVYTMSNAVAGNAVLAWDRAADGTLTFAASYPTGGTGTGAGLGNQGAVTLSANGRWLLVVNAGSNSVSAFRRAADGSLTLTDTESSAGTMPNSVAIRNGLVYVLNAGGSGNIAGFVLTEQGALESIAGSSQPTSRPGAGAAQISFTRDGFHVVVTERMTNSIVTYPVSRTGVAGAGTVNASSGVTPFGFGVDNRGNVVVSNATGGMAGAGSLSSYRVRDLGTLEVRAAQVADFQSAPCWVAISTDSRFAYTTNAASRTVSGYAIGAMGQLTLLDASGVTASTSGAPTDVAATAGYLYVLSQAAGNIDAFAIGASGSLQPIAGATGMPSGANGIAAW